ncbi:hypothetical protein RFI_00934 [Reticulomyxa filosa]|uniref:mannosyl-oligosaccharide glucosidase n=1 Tax=Reticulomyxa filosa TaxID=46433 RepID=X6PD27_RETFI|nr:hypothetical protein RFI_00934 [Reticulomyxa filosa]|eukprot:ETO36126.1 hypothetical protein RFI_00934 [Reticulomyxa filosa]
MGLAQWTSFLKENFSKLERHLDWYVRTQTSPRDKNIFRWSGRTSEHNLPSGLDDYPRYPNVTDHLQEGHVDMQCWMIKLFSVMADLALTVQVFKQELTHSWRSRAQVLQQKLDEHFWNEEKLSYQDFAIVDGNSPQSTAKKIFVDHVGYVSIFPLLLQALPDSHRNFEHLLNQISDYEGIWTEFGLRSLSKSDKAYHTGDDYWKGAIWINMNYLTVKALHDYSLRMNDGDKLKQRTRELYDRLRTNVYKNIVREYYRLGYLFENYDDRTGNGQRSKPFTGWTALGTKNKFQDFWNKEKNQIISNPFEKIIYEQ